LNSASPAGDGLGRVVGQDRGRLALGQLVAGGRGDTHLDTRQRTHDGQRARDVVAVADVRQHAAVERAEGLAQRLQVGERLARMVLRRQHVHDGNSGMFGKAVDLVLVPGAQADHGGVAGEHQRGVADRLAAGELQLVRAQDHRMPAEFEDAGLERRARARGRLVEDQRDGPAFERPRGQRRRLERGGALEQQGEAVGVQLCAGDEVRGCGH